MVQSSTISITPSQHADNHQTTGSDPLTGTILTSPHHGSHEAGGADEISINEYGLYVLNDVDIVHENATERNFNLKAAYTKIKETYTQFGGYRTIRISFACKNSDASVYDCDVKIYRNGVAVGTERVTGASGAWSTHIEDIEGCVARDLLQIYAHTHNGGNSVSVKDFRILGIWDSPGLDATNQDP